MGPSAGTPAGDIIISSGTDDPTTPDVRLRLENLFDSYTEKWKFNLPVGKHTITIKNIKLFGRSSGLARTVSGLPITFTFEVK